MGFTTGFIGGLTATYTLLYLSLHLHRSNRVHQSLLLQQQKHLMTIIHTPEMDVIESPAYEVRRAGLSEELKDRWNREVAGVVRSLQDTDWEDVRVRWERRLGNVWRNVGGGEAVREGLDKVREGVEGVKDRVEGVKDGVAEGTREKRLLEIK